MTHASRLANWMLENGFTTGHGDALEDVLSELTIQIVADRMKRPTLEDEEDDRLEHDLVFGELGVKVREGMALHPKGDYER